MSMRKTSVYLDEALSERLKALAEREGRTQAEVIRDAIIRYDQVAGGKRKFALAGVVSDASWLIGDQPDEELLRGFGE